MGVSRRIKGLIQRQGGGGCNRLAAIEMPLTVPLPLGHIINVPDILGYCKHTRIHSHQKGASMPSNLATDLAFVNISVGSALSTFAWVTGLTLTAATAGPVLLAVGASCALCSGVYVVARSSQTGPEGPGGGILPR
jgi:hypothetical protein